MATPAKNRKLGSFTNGTFVWAKMSRYPWWPAIVVRGSDAGLRTAVSGSVWVYWWGDSRVSEVKTEHICNFSECFVEKYSTEKISNHNKKIWNRGVCLAIKEYAKLLSLDSEKWTESQCINWANSELELLYSKKKYTSVLSVPEIVKKDLEKFRIKNEENSSCEEDLTEIQKDAAKNLKIGKLEISSICIGCFSSDTNDLEDHPLFYGSVCGKCKDRIKCTMYAFGSDGINCYCAICGHSGEVTVCDQRSCGRVYCNKCIDNLTSSGSKEKILKRSPWPCFLCENIPDNSINGNLKRREDWVNRVSKLFHTNYQTIPCPEIDKSAPKKPIRVLSLFDGIGTGLIVLDKLNMDVELFASCEINSDAINVVRKHFGDRVQHLGDVKDLTNSQLNDLAPIDLLIGGSPCNDLSLVNPARKGLYDATGTGILFFDFYRILKQLEFGNNGRKLFWFFENVAAMPMDIKNTINRFLESEPFLIDAKWFSPQQRPRFFWGNIPGIGANIPIEDQSFLNDSLTPNCNRIACVDKIRTVTTRSNSLRQGKSMLFPVEMDGEGDTLWTTELETVFGFPPHYTDVGNLSAGRRQQLLGRAWSVPVISYILKPLKDFYLTKNSEDTD